MGIRTGVIAAAVIVAASLGVGFVTATHSVAGQPTAAAAVQGAKHGQSKLKEARTSCAADGMLTEAHDGEVTLVIEGAGVDNSGYDDPELSDDVIAEMNAVRCVLEGLDAPVAMTARMDSTRALDGMQDAEWDGYHATWTFHPDDGLNLTLTEN